jgi:hypothetical protein
MKVADRRQVSRAIGTFREFLVEKMNAMIA